MVMDSRARMVSGCLAVLAAAMVAMPAVGQEREVAGDAREDALSRPTEASLRFTPEMARAMGRLFAREALADRYDLPEDQWDEAGELIARRLMELNSKFDTAQSQQDAERLLGDVLETVSEFRGGQGPPGIPPKMGRAVGEVIAPVLPEVRKMVQGVTKDIRPMLGVKQQLKLMGDMAGFSTAFDSFEQTMQRWSTGEVDPFEVPFGRQPEPIKRDENGRSEQLRKAEEVAERLLEVKREKQWKHYVDEASEFYEFDAAQSGSAESLLREFVERADAITQDPDWRERAYRNRLWSGLFSRSWRRSNHPFTFLLEDQYRRINDPLEQLDGDFKRRIEDIPTEGQRQAALQRVRDVLADRGYRFGASAEDEEEPASDVEEDDIDVSREDEPAAEDADRADEADEDEDEADEDEPSS